MSYYYLDVIRGVETGRKYPLPEGAVSVGRSSQNTIALHSSEKSVSGHHAIIYKTEDRILFQDMESTNGSFVNEIAVKEQSLHSGDIIGFGKNGPRLKLIISDKEIDVSQLRPEVFVSPESTSIKTKEDSVSKFIIPAGDFTSSENLSSMTNVKLKSPEPVDGKGPFSRTVELEKKILNKNLGAGDMHDLMKDGKRVEKIVERGNISKTQAGMIRTVHAANKRVQRQWIFILTGVVTVSVCIIAFFAIRAFQYKALVNRGLNLRAQMDNYEESISKANKDPDANKRVLDSLINALDKAKSDLAQVKDNVRQSDFGKFYSDPLERTIDEVLMRFGETDYHIPREMVERVRYHIGIYSGPLHSTIAKYIIRKEKYFTMIRQIFKNNNIPEDLAYVSMLESGYNPNALSHCGARGLWQFMPETGKRYGLRVDQQTDERLDPEKATYASARYFRELIAIFGGKSSLMLAMAAYNAGEGRIVGALRKIDNPMRNRDFWYIYRMGYLAEETNEYIPRVIALLIISEHPEKYNFQNLRYAAPDTYGQLDAENDFIPLDNIRDTSSK
jgi:pSer/pThr/pTyr-binding forkhead associated (FHA) protein